MRVSKRITDLVLALVLALVLSPIILLITLLILVRDGRPVFYLSERMKTPDQAFILWKFRTMTVANHDSGVSGGDKAARVTRTGRILRKTRFDELPQLLNILRGDMSFVGPRPPLRHYVEKHPAIYAQVLTHRPGVTGLATLRYHRTEERLLATCQTAEQTDQLYSRRCVPVKARLDMIWAENQSLCFDMRLILETVARIIGASAKKR
ncbi:sugar transferase [Roseovarius gahaiensis]|uniref:Sugar transferase n=1 Tax=Roseovarius gahaiensis TaxID=2716691 RepID=A0A967EGA0_9RHOB|nr:sugar transferase [Roseovarius gahaiensis]NHQ74701.1 sugar transferase [Roseovarius gahaiensis]